MRALMLLLAACAGPAIPSGASLPAPFTGLPLDVAGATAALSDDDLTLRYTDGSDFRTVLSRLDAGLTAAGWTQLTFTPIPGGAAVTWQKDGRALKALGGGSKGRVNVLVQAPYSPDVKAEE